MHLAHQITRPDQGGLRRRIALVASALTIGLTLGGIVAEGASAASATLRPGQSSNFPTWGLGKTMICTHNTSNEKSGTVMHSAFGSGPSIHALSPNETWCKSEAWWGFNVRVANVSPSDGPTFDVSEPGGPH